MKIRLQCACGQRYKIALEHAGKYFACKGCRKSLYVPVPPPVAVPSQSVSAPPLPPSVATLPVVPVAAIPAAPSPSPPVLPPQNTATSDVPLVLKGAAGALIVGSGLALIALLVTAEAPSEVQPHQANHAASAPVESFQPSRQAMATKAAWNQIRQIGIESAILDSTNQLELFRRVFLAYAQVQLDDVDPELAEWQMALLATLREICDLLAAYDAELIRLQTEVGAAQSIGGQIGSLYQPNPQGGAAAVQFLLGLAATLEAETKLAAMSEQSKRRLAELLAKVGEKEQQLPQLKAKLQSRYEFELLDMP